VGVNDGEIELGNCKWGCSWAARLLSFVAEFCLLSCVIALREAKMKDVMVTTKTQKKGHSLIRG
jgi:hypothetical protein